MTVCAKYWNAPNNASLDLNSAMWPSKEACCQAGGGAYVNGDLIHCTCLYQSTIVLASRLMFAFALVCEKQPLYLYLLPVLTADLAFRLAVTRHC